ncbi:hypothetical protein EVAR_22179_1 [Eumeta japonica]|uniref:Uncharacterized protein n=1 Tax=Eumeta variegata TaxID=151549 RepID=A0A4C1XZT6_EUMVA|nr:hypothetical protein EVAR_22179_1 [Eumeta japonica]
MKSKFQTERRVWKTVEPNKNINIVNRIGIRRDYDCDYDAGPVGGEWKFNITKGLKVFFHELAFQPFDIARMPGVIRGEREVSSACT